MRIRYAGRRHSQTPANQQDFLDLRVPGLKPLHSGRVYKERAAVKAYQTPGGGGVRAF